MDDVQHDKKKMLSYYKKILYIQSTNNSQHHVDINVLPESIFQIDRIISIL